MGLTPEATSSGRGRAGGWRHRILAVILVIAAFLLLNLMSQEPVVSGFFLLSFTGAGMAGVLWWSGREATRTMRRRTRLVIAQILSDGRPLNREELVHEVRRRVVPLRHAALRCLRIEDRALVEMTRAHRLDFHGGRYSMVRSSPPRNVGTHI